MIPDDELSATAHVAGFSFPVKQPGDLLVDWELGGVALNDPSQGLRVKLWTCKAVRNDDTGDMDVTVTAPGVATTVLFSGAGITEVAISFDQNMHPFVAYMKAGAPWIYWYDPTVPGMTHTALPAGCYDLRCTLDDKRTAAVSDSDIVLCYIRAGTLYRVYQRNRYGSEKALRTGIGAGARLVSIAMNVGSRLQWHLRNYTRTDDPGALLQSSPFLADVVADLLRRSGVPPASINTAQLWTPVEGYKVATEAGADAMIEPLQGAWFFDPAEWDGQLRFLPRGQPAELALTADALVVRDEDALAIERVQEAELLRKVTLTTIDSSIDYTTNTQTAERRTGTVLAKAESSSEIPITAAPDFVATVALRKIKVAWGELQTYKFTLPIGYSYLTPTDVIMLTDQRGRAHRMRLMDIQEDGGMLICEASEDAPWAYDAEALGVAAAPPASTTPGLVGDTVVAVLNIPVQRDEDDQLGYYVAAAGTGRGWYGAEVQMSTDGGASIASRLQVTVPATVGETVTALLPELSGEYLSRQTVRVTVPDPLESVDYETLLRYNNRAAVQRADGSWEVLQFQTATQVADDTFDLAGLVRGRYATAQLDVPAGARFVLLDDAVVFVQIQQWMLGQTVSYRGVSYGQDSDDVSWATFAVADVAAQAEWAPVGITASRDGSGNVTVGWIPRPRLGVETAPRQSQYFTGYRLTWSDAVTEDVGDVSTHTRTSVPSGTSVTVAGLNSITGPGPASEAITA